MAKPNIIVMMLDDARDDDLDAMPQMMSIMGPPNGRQLTRCQDGDPLCAPSRSSFLTGRYPHHHGVWGNDNVDGQGFNGFNDVGCLPGWLKAAGYQTAMVGKYLNGYGLPSANKPATYVPGGWDDWRATQEGTYDYNNTDGPRNVNVNGSVVQSTEYITTWVKKKVLDRIDAWYDDPGPFFIWASFVACHNKHPDPESKYRGTSGVGQVSSPALNNPTGKPPWIQDLPPLTQAELDDIVVTRRERRETLKSVDDAVQAIRDKLVERGQLNDTLIFFVSDNGYLLGEHRLQHKQMPYEKSVQVPLLMKWPNGPVTNGEFTRTCSTLDITKTIVDVAQASPTHPLDGVSLLAPMPTVGKRPVLSEGGANNGNPQWRSLRVKGNNGADFMYVEWGLADDVQFTELYEMGVDPWQTNNLHGNPTYAVREASLAAMLDQLRDGSGTDYDVAWVDPG